MSTRGIQILKKLGIDHQVITYSHDAKGAAFAARATGFDPAATIKTLVVALTPGGHALALMPGDRELSLKKMARACGAKKAAMASTTDAQRLTGYLVGGISPFGTAKRLPVIMETTLAGHPQVMINAGQRGIMVRMKPDDIARATGARMADLIHKQDPPRPDLTG